jgi:hypothetical protein
MNRYNVNEKHKLEDGVSICVYGKTENGQVQPPKTFCLEGIGPRNIWYTLEMLELLVRNAKDIGEFLETHRDLVMSASARKEEFKAKREGEKVARQQEAKVKSAVENVVTSQVLEMFKTGNPETLAALAAIFSKKTA